MPLYTFVCPLCNGKLDEIRSVEHRHEPMTCLCGEEMERRVEPFRASTFTPYYDEGLGCDVHSLQEKKTIMKALGVIEIGDRVGGARNFDKHAPSHVSKFELRGIAFKPPSTDSDQVVETVTREGTVVSRAKFSELPSSK